MFLAAIVLAFLPVADPAKLAAEYARAVAEVNDAHVARPVAKSEEELAKKLPDGAVRALAELVKAKETPELAAALSKAGEAALDLDRVDDFERVRARLAQVAPDDARKLGIALSRPRFVARGTDGVEKEGLEALANVFDLVLDEYDVVFGLTSFSKVPGKKLRLRARLVEKITAPPHFAPQFPWHSEIDFPVVDARALASPTPEGQMLFYGLCHELGHVLAMWGDRDHEEDHHAWAHYCGVTIAEELTRARKDDPALAALKDARWRSLHVERALLTEKKQAPGLADERSVMALLVALHDLVGPRAIGAALVAMEKAEKLTRVNRVRHYRMKDFEDALKATDAGKAKTKEIAALFAGK